MPVVNGVIVLESDQRGECGYPIITRGDCDPHTIYLIPAGAPAPDVATGQVVAILPGYYVNPRQCGVVKNVK